MKDPVFDVIVPVHNVGRWVDLCVRALEHHTKHPFRLIIVDNASTEPLCLEVLAQAEARGHTVLRMAENKSFSNSVNAGVRAGSAPNVVILNDDAVVAPGWDQHFLQDLADESVGMTGARSNYASGRQGMGVLFDDAPFLVFVCVGIRRKLWDELGPMDEVTFDGFSTEDLHFSYLVRWCAAVVEGGVRKLVKSPKPLRKLRVSNAFVLHAGSQTLQAQLGSIENLNANNAKYMARLEQIWGKEFVAANTRPAPRVLACSFSAEEWTRVNFMICLLGLKTGSGFNFAYHHVTRLPIHLARLQACEKALAEGYDFVLLLDDDMIFLPDTLTRLVKHMQDPDVVLVNALAYGRKPPYHACIYKQSANGIAYDNLEGWEGRGLLEVDGTGLSCALLRTSALRKLDDFYYDKLTAEEKLDVATADKARARGHKWFGHFEHLGEDLYFCRRLRDAGFKCHVDTDLVIGHVGEAEIVGPRVKRAFLERQAQAAAHGERVNG